MALAIYEPAVTEGGEWAIPVDPKSFEYLRTLAERGSPAARDWKPFEVQLLRKQGGRSWKESDCPWLGSHVMVLRPAAVAVFSEFLGDDAELLPLRCADADLTLLNAWRLLDALDLSQSDVIRFPSSGRIMKVKSYRFDDAMIDGHTMFRLTAVPGGMFIQRPVVDAAQRAGLRQVSFKLASQAEAPPFRLPTARTSVSVADMAAASDEELWSILYQALIPRVTGTRDEQYTVVKSWTKGLQMLWATQLVDDEVNNGGFNQYFFNSSGQFAMEAIEGFQLIGSHERADLVRQAVDQLFRDAPRLRQFYEQRTMEAFMESYKHTDLGAIDEAWFKASEFFTPRTQYMREHPQEFVIRPT
jgi:Domain of unknown function (DUF4375)